MRGWSEWISVCERNNIPAEGSQWGALWESNQCVERTDTYPGTAERTGGQTGGRSADRPRSAEHKKSDQHTETCTIHWLTHCTTNYSTQQHIHTTSAYKIPKPLCVAVFEIQLNWTRSRLKVLISGRKVTQTRTDLGERTHSFSLCCCSFHKLFYYLILQQNIALSSAPLSFSTHAYFLPASLTSQTSNL